MTDRRSFLAMSSAALAGASFGGRAAFATVPGDNRLVIVILRGGLDGMHALVPHGDNRYAKLRPRISKALNDAGGLADLDGYFGLHHALADLMPLYRSKQLLLMPAAGTVYQARSHFDAQNVLENGSGKPYAAKTGWLNRAITLLNAGDQRLGLSIGPTVPLILQGDSRVQTWSNSRLPEVDDDFLQRIARSYQGDDLFLETIQDANGALQPDIDMNTMKSGRRDNFPVSAKAAADLLAQPEGPRVGVLEMGGWDTHFDQERRLSKLFSSLSHGLLTLKQGLGKEWRRTAVLVVSEFGRTAAENANRGTDHGTGGLAILAGGAVAGGQIIGEWPGLSDSALRDGRDIRTSNSYESLFKGLLMSHLALSDRDVEQLVFPASQQFKPMTTLTRKV